MRRREFLGGAALAGLTGCAHRTATVATPALRAPFSSPALRAPYGTPPALLPIRAEVDRIFRITVCSRPFRAAGPRLDVERVGEKTVVHNYGHGGSGWSLSWGSAAVVVEKAMPLGERDIAVIGCGALGLTSALMLQRAGARVTIYAKERPPDVRSSRATGSFTPDSRVALTNAVSPDFPALWEKMCRASFHTYESYLGMAGDPVEWTDRYALSDTAPGQPSNPAPAQQPAEGLSFATYRDRIADLSPHSHDMPPGTSPFPSKYARRTSSLTFNIAGLTRQLMNDFFVAGGRMENVEFHTPSELSTLSQKVIVNATGYGARALWKDVSVVPVRGQIAWLIPQPDVHYGVQYKSVYILARRDGIVVQDLGKGEMEGYNDPSEQPDRAAAEASVRLAAELFTR